MGLGDRTVRGVPFQAHPKTGMEEKTEMEVHRGDQGVGTGKAKDDSGECPVTASYKRETFRKQNKTKKQKNTNDRQLELNRSLFFLTHYARQSGALGRCGGSSSSRARTLLNCSYINISMEGSDEKPLPRG